MVHLGLNVLELVKCLIVELVPRAKWRRAGVKTFTYELRSLEWLFGQAVLLGLVFVSLYTSRMGPGFIYSQLNFSFHSLHKILSLSALRSHLSDSRPTLLVKESGAIV